MNNDWKIKITSMDKIFENNSSFPVKWGTTRKVQFLLSRSLLLALTKFSFWEEEWLLGYMGIMKFLYYSELSQFPKILSLNSFGNSYILV